VYKKNRLASQLMAVALQSHIRLMDNFVLGAIVGVHCTRSKYTTTATIATGSSSSSSDTQHSNATASVVIVKRWSGVQAI